MKKKVGLLLVIGMILSSISVQANIPGRTYFEIENYYFRHIIEPGDTFYNLSSQFKADLNKLQELNPELDANNLQIGQEIKINISNQLDYYILQPGDTLWEISKRNGFEMDRIIEINDLNNPSYLLAGEVILLPQKSFLARKGNIKITEFKQKGREINLSGLGRTFEANIRYALETETDKVLQEGFTTALAGGPYWGSFDIELTDIPTTADYLTVFAVNMKDGSRQDEIKLELD
ncbi:LysM peptidoglycan-binding domain-containing protein [Halanaerobaculum tunisiense]